MKLYIIIISFNSGVELIQLVESLKNEKVPGWELNIVVVENGGGQKLETRNLKLEIIKNRKNLGFAGGCNVGILYALENKANKILLLNPDVVIESGFIQSLIQNSADIVSPVIKFQRNCGWIHDYGGKVNWIWGRTEHLESTNNPINKLSNKQIDYVSGCAMLVKREVFEKVGLFDDKFFLYFEDVDFCLRAKKAGFKIAVEEKVSIIHKLKEGKEKSVFQKWHMLRSNYIFINRYLGRNKILGYMYLKMLFVKMCIHI